MGNCVCEQCGALCDDSYCDPCLAALLAAERAEREAKYGPDGADADADYDYDYPVVRK